MIVRCAYAMSLPGSIAAPLSGASGVIDLLRAQAPLQRDADYERFAQALRQAGMPE